MRCINCFGNIYEGRFQKGLKMNGFCISYLGHSGRIEVGWYKNDRRIGNWLSFDGIDPTRRYAEGWYVADVRMDDRKEDAVYPNFQISDVFLDHDLYVLDRLR